MKKKTKRKFIQVFIMPSEQDNCEVSAELVQFNETVSGRAFHVVTREEDGTIYEHFFPLHNISMVRIREL